MKPTALNHKKDDATSEMGFAFSARMKWMITIMISTSAFFSCQQDDDLKPIPSSINHKVLEEPFPVMNLNAYLLDLNEDGIQDFSINVMSVGFDRGVRNYFQIQSNRDARVMLTEEEITPLSSGTAIGPETASEVSKWSIFTGALMVRTVTENQPDQWSGPWAPDKDFYAGLSIRVDGEYHYGWVKLLGDRESHAVFVQEYAFNAKPNQAIKAGQRK